MKKKVVKQSKTKKVHHSKAAKQSSSTFWGSYTKERDSFYESNPSARALIGVLIIAAAISIGLFYYKKNQVYIGLELDKYGVEYPYVEPVKAR